MVDVYKAAKWRFKYPPLMLMWVVVLVYTKTVRWYGIKILLKLIYSYNDYIAFLVQIPRKCLGGKKLMIFRVWEAFYSVPSAFSTVSVDTFHKLWKLSEFFFLKSWGRQWYEKGTLKPAEWPALISSFLKQWFTMRELDLKRGFTWKVKFLHHL